MVQFSAWSENLQNNMNTTPAIYSSQTKQSRNKQPITVAASKENKRKLPGLRKNPTKKTFSGNWIKLVSDMENMESSEDGMFFQFP